MAKKQKSKSKKASASSAAAPAENGKGKSKKGAPKLSEADAKAIAELEQVFGVGNAPETRRLAAEIERGDFGPEAKALAKELSARTTVDPVPMGIGLGAIVLAITVALVLLTTP